MEELRKKIKKKKDNLSKRNLQSAGCFQKRKLKKSWFLIITSSDSGNFTQNVLEFFNHVGVINLYCQFPACLVIFGCALIEFHVLFLHSHIIIYYHLHVSSIILFLLYSFFLLFSLRLILCCLRYFFLDHVCNFFSFKDLFNGFFMFFHLTQYRCFV